MSDKFCTLTVTLNRDLPQDEVELVMSAIRQLQAVSDVSATAQDPMGLMAIVRARRDLENRLWDVLYPKESK